MFSLKEYLTVGKLEAPFKEHMTEICASSTITRVSLAYLSQLQEQPTITEIEEELPLVRYAAEYWMDYATICKDDEEVNTAILKFFLEQRQAYAVWSRIYRPCSVLMSRLPRPSPQTTSLYYASYGGLEQVVETLLKEGADVNAQGGSYVNALQVAAWNGNGAAVRLINRGADVNAQGGYFGNALKAAVQKGNEEMVRLLVESGADVNVQGGHYGSALQAAATNGNQAAASQLVAAAANSTVKT